METLVENNCTDKNDQRKLLSSRKFKTINIVLLMLKKQPPEVFCKKRCS